MALHRETFTHIAKPRTTQRWQSVNGPFNPGGSNYVVTDDPNTVAKGFMTAPAQPYRNWECNQLQPQIGRSRFDSTSSQEPLLPERHLSASWGTRDLQQELGGRPLQTLDIPLSLNTRTREIATESSCCDCFSSPSVKDKIQRCESEAALIGVMNNTFSRASINDIRDGLDQIGESELTQKGYDYLILKCVSLFSKKAPQATDKLSQETSYIAHKRLLTLQLNLSDYKGDLKDLKDGLGIALRQGADKTSTLSKLEEWISEANTASLLNLVPEEGCEVFAEPDSPVGSPPGYFEACGKGDEAAKVVSTQPGDQDESPLPSAPPKTQTHEGDLDFRLW